MLGRANASTREGGTIKIYLYYKVDRGFYESAYAVWRRQGGRFADHLVRAQPTFYTWKREFERQGCAVEADVRSSFLLPQTLRCYLPLPLARLLRGVLWVSKADPWLLQQDIVRRIGRLQPDVAFFPLGSSVWTSTLRRLKARGIRLVQYADLPAATMMERDRGNLPYFDLIMQPADLSAGFRLAGATARVEYVPVGVDPQVYRPISLTADERARYGSDVCFIGGLGTGFHSQRRKLVEYAVEHGVRLKIWGGYRQHFAGSPILRCWQGQIWGEEQVKALCAARIGLNAHVDHQPGELSRGLNLRAFELAACGVFQLLQYVPGVHEFFEVGKEVVCFDGPEDMLNKIHYYLAHDEERAAIAQAARARALSDHTWSQRVRQMIQYMSELPSS
jgi:spore maturation protein CgeB